jgi:hypothetical protein
VPGSGPQCLWMTRHIRLRRERAAAASGSDEGDGEVMADVREAQACRERGQRRVRRANERERCRDFVNERHGGESIIRKRQYR